MKIIVNRKDETVCYMQLRDLVFLANKNLQVFRKLSIQHINEGKTMEEFVRINNRELIKYIEQCDDIIEFDDYVNNSIESISNAIVTRNLLFKVDANNSRKVMHQTDDLHDIIAFKQGQLHYQIPLVCTDDIDINLDGVRVRSTILKNRFIVTNDGDKDITSLLPMIKDIIINKLNMNPQTKYECDIKEFNGSYILSLVSVKKTKNSVFKMIKKRIDK